MNTYAAKHAELYDRLYADKPYASEAAFVAALLRTHSRTDRPVHRLLDVACGTGNHALAFHALGFEVFGIDASESMLEIARRKIDATGGRVRVERQDMRTLELDAQHGAPFDSAICLFDSIGHVVDTASVEATLSGIRRHLLPDGIAVIEFWHAPAFLAGFERWRVRRLATPGAEVLRVSETVVDLVEQTARIEYQFLEISADGACVSSNETMRVRFFGVAEMAALLKHSGLEPLAFYDGYSSVTSIGPQSLHVIAVARRV